MKIFFTLALTLLISFSYLLGNNPEDSTFVITDSLLVANTPPSPGVIFPSLFAGIPGMLNFAAPAARLLLLNDNLLLGEAGFAIFSLSYPFFVGNGLNKIRRFNEKQRLIIQYTNYKIIDKSRSKAETTPSIHLHFGLLHSKFKIFDSGNNISFSAGITYNYPLSKYFAINTGMGFQRHNVSLKNKIYSPESAHTLQYFTLINVDYQGVDLSFPIEFQTTFYRAENYTLFISLGYSFIFSIPGGKVDEIKNFEPNDYDDFDLNYSESWGPNASEELIYSVGFNVDEYQLKLSYSLELYSNDRSPGEQVYIDDKMNIIELRFGWKIY